MRRKRNKTPPTRNINGITTTVGHCRGIGQSLLNQTNNTMRAFGAALLSLFSLVSVDARVKRVKAGKIYKEHDPVLIVVNKVG